MKKLVALVLASVMLLSLVGTASAADTTLEVMIWYRDIDDLDFENMPYYNDPVTGINAQSGVNVVFNQVKGADWEQKRNLMLTSNEYPDIIVRGGINLEMYGVDQEILLPLDDLIDQYMPNYKALLESDAALADGLRSSDGKMYQIGWIIPQNINTDSHMFINKQWLDNLGLQIPTTLEELEQVLIAFRDQDADGDGDPSNEIPYGGTLADIQNGILTLLRDFGLPYNSDFLAISDEGKVYSQFAHPNLRAALETIHRWYDEGLIDVESVAQDTNAFEAKVNAGNYGCFWRWRMTAMGTEEAVYNQYECILPPAAEGYSTLLPYMLELPGFGAAITVAAEKHGTVEAACKWLDTQFQWDNMINGYNGMQGEFWDYAEDGMVDIWPMTDGTRSVPGQSSMYYCSGTEYFAKVKMPSHRIEKTSYCEWYSNEGLLEQVSHSILQSLIKFTVEESERVNLLRAEIDKFGKESISSFIVKGITDESWANYEKTLNDLRLDELVGLYQTAYDRYVEANK